MPILSAENLAKSYGAQDVFWDVSLQVARGDKIALIGPNGHGKTTLLRILAGLEHPTGGTVERARNLSVGYLPQVADLDSAHSLYGEARTAFEPLLAMQAQLRRLEREMADPDQREAVLRRYGELQERFELAGGYEYPHEIERVLTGVGFKPEEFSLPVSLLSGGQKTRALLAKLLLQRHDVLLLDEPTNHLDIAAIEWLEAYLRDWDGTFIVVAHDRYFLDEVVGRVWELSFGRLEAYRGNYTQYVEQRAERYERRMEAFEAQQLEIARTEDFIRRYKAGQRSKQARGRERRLERLERLEKPKEARAMKLSMQTQQRSGDLVLVSDGMEVGYAARDGLPSVSLFRCSPMTLERGEKVALIGPNGSGKTSLLRTLLGEIPPLSGAFHLGASLRVGYVPQGYSDLNLDNTVLDELLSVKNIPIGKARDILGRFLFSGDDVLKRVEALSGGERARVELAKLTLLGANFLLLDEPTSHLDMLSREVLEEVLLDFNGTLVIVSHDRYFINALASQIWVVDGGQLTVYPWGYKGFLEAREKARADHQVDEEAQERRKPTSRPPTGRLPKGIKQEAERIEAEIAALESRLGELEGDIAQATERKDARALWDLGEEYQRLEEALHRRLEEWTVMTSRLQTLAEERPDKTTGRT